MIEIRMKDDKTRFSPFDQMEAEITWDSSVVHDIKVELLWSTRGRGSEDTYVQDARRIAVKQERSSMKNLIFQAPVGPYSFSGKLISLIWYLSASDEGGSQSAELELVIAPGEKEIIIDQGMKAIQ